MGKEAVVRFFRFKLSFFNLSALPLYSEYGVLITVIRFQRSCSPVVLTVYETCQGGFAHALIHKTTWPVHGVAYQGYRPNMVEAVSGRFIRDRLLYWIASRSEMISESITCLEK